MAEHTYYNDIEPYCCKVLSKNIERGYLPGGYVDGRDIREITAADLVGYQHIHLFAGIGGFPLGIVRANVPLHLRIITGGFPCQDISNAGKRAGITGERSGLWKEMYRLICDIRPDYVCVENVAALLNRGIDTVLGDLASCGYDAEWQVLSAVAFGAPHLRKRVFIVAYPSNIRPQTLHKEHRFFYQGARGKGDIFTTSIFSSYGRKNATRLLWQSEPGVRRVADGIPARVDRLRGLGNAIVPQIAEYIGHCIVARELVRNGREAS